MPEHQTCRNPKILISYNMLFRMWGLKAESIFGIMLHATPFIYKDLNELEVLYATVVSMEHKCGDHHTQSPLTLSPAQ